MYPFTSYELAKSRAADLHDQARRDTLARAALQAGRAGTHRPRQPAPAHLAAVRRLVAAVGARTSS
jgi:hypothetical protein